MELINLIMPELMKLLGVVIGILIYAITKKIKEIFKKQLENDTIKNVIHSTVRYIEQVYKDIHGEDKLNKAKEVVFEVLGKYGINISDKELEILIESAVNSMNRKED